MKYKVLKSLIYGGTSYGPSQDIEILEKSVAENCLERELIEEIKEKVDTAEEVVSAETTENQDTANNDGNNEEKQVTPEKSNKSGKNKYKLE